ncbi:probable prolyl 4-hydroxylase 9 isoform X1 [Arachis duranensis]|uniref:procollagen-proline 4-dioxygenase n=1 Tax=Arachis duranensis TaxID=130453 RepID=A0A6P4BGI0_ARADU|nr:probable prolyl 4-hydroxylase 9 isoform X1 [Arachis duranensis]
MKGKAKRSKVKLGVPVLVMVCSLFFFTGLFVSPMLFNFQDFGDVGQGQPWSRLLQESAAKEYGKSGDPFLHSIPFQILSWRPRIVYFPNFTTADVCEKIIEMAKPKLEPSKLALREGETVESTKGTRTSSGAFISASEDKSGILDFIEKKIAKVTMIPTSHGEAFNILRYEVLQKYDTHYDAFDPFEYGNVQSQRIASFLLYLSSVEAGGETMFPFEDGLNMDIGYDYKQCIGLKVKPRQGDGLLFYSVLPDGNIDKTSLHGSCPVIEGEKWVATKWINDKKQHY